MLDGRTRRTLASTEDEWNRIRDQVPDAIPLVLAARHLHEHAVDGELHPLRHLRIPEDESVWRNVPHVEAIAGVRPLEDLVEILLELLAHDVADRVRVENVALDEYIPGRRGRSHSPATPS